MTEQDNPGEYIKTGAYDLYIEGLQGIQEDNGLTLEEARDRALQDAINSHGDEHIPLIHAAYNYLIQQSSQEK